jgi:penicillin-binding protein 1C
MSEVTSEGEMSDASSPQIPPSCPGLTRASTPLLAGSEDGDGRDKPGHDGAGERRGVRVIAIAFALICITSIAFTGWVISLGPWRLPVDAKRDVDPAYLKLLLAYEDQRFYSHRGVDPLALTRAVFQLITRGHIVSGGSTITMQLARLMEPRRERSLYAKLRQIVRALQIERQLDKDQILNLYLALAPYGGNLEGIRAASIAYLGKEPKRLSLTEAALLVALPQSPERRRLDRYPLGRGAIACSIGWWRKARSRHRTLRRPRPVRCRNCASRCRYWRPTPPIRRSRR